ncbi:hypothetical protein DEI81_14485 [Curtobacterium sp. MCBD17_013]|nr:hypothetical protein DEI81_14485 [Curtobacterium sp. MCBD17_013]
MPARSVRRRSPRGVAGTARARRRRAARGPCRRVCPAPRPPARASPAGSRRIHRCGRRRPAKGAPRPGREAVRDLSERIGSCELVQVIRLTPEQVTGRSTDPHIRARQSTGVPENQPNPGVRKTVTFLVAHDLQGGTSPWTTRTRP